MKWHLPGIQRKAVHHGVASMTLRRTLTRSTSLIAVLATLSVLMLLASAMLTAAAFRDSSWMNLGSDDGIGGSNRFQLGLVTDPTIVDQNATAGVVSMLDDPDAVDWPITGAGGFVPGQTLKTQVPVFNDSPLFFADVRVAVEQRSAQKTDISDYLQITARNLTTGETLFEKRYLAQLETSPGELSLAPRGTAKPHQDGDAYVPGGKGAAAVIEFEVHYAETSASGAQDTASLNGGKSLLRMTFDGASRKPE